MNYRVKQFIWGLTAKLSKDDRAFVNRYLDEYESMLFFKLPRNEQVHSIKVATAVIEESRRYEKWNKVKDNSQHKTIEGMQQEAEAHKQLKSAENNLQEEIDIYLIKAAFLHDIGKINSGLNIVTKSILVIMDKLSPKLLTKLTRIKFVNTYYNHPEIAIGYLPEANDKVKYYIRNHHNYALNNDEKLKIIQKSDSKN